jgi:hypothetical protein
MKIVIPTIIISCIIVAVVWYADVAKDKKSTLFVSATTTAYNDWECGNITESCKETFKLSANTNHNVYRIRYGKDFMAIKVKNNNQAGWVIYGPSTKLVKNPSTNKCQQQDC